MADPAAQNGHYLPREKIALLNDIDILTERVFKGKSRSEAHELKTDIYTLDLRERSAPFRDDPVVQLGMAVLHARAKGEGWQKRASTAFNAACGNAQNLNLYTGEYTPSFINKNLSNFRRAKFLPDQRILVFARAAHNHYPGCMDLANTFASILIGAEHFSEAIGFLRKQYESNPNAASANLLGTAYYKSGQIDEARKTFENGHEKFPHARHLATSFGSFCRKNGNPGDALALLEPAYQETGHVPMVTIISDSYMDLGDREEARHVLEEALKKNPGHQSLVTALKKMTDFRQYDMY